MVSDPFWGGGVGRRGHVGGGGRQIKLRGRVGKLAWGIQLRGHVGKVTRERVRSSRGDMGTRGQGEGQNT